LVENLSRKSEFFLEGKMRVRMRKQRFGMKAATLMDLYIAEINQKLQM
jgi:hypothetical protein